ncbi:hypothetical protein [Sandaracinus amylolyticus]|uniref:hypothetical protein n=1 Tax=Sandaracinus amylolyticus TaxID=927083 RepID=UPI001F2880AB|nr:hypothetical protein [Sandaracinus amylolyticus]UJR84553.1 Hypothetical protein I5071_66320 [Sandaracinus amylolyticus]
MRRVVIALGIVLAGCAGAMEPRRYLASDPHDTCDEWDLECSRAAYGTYGCGPSGCGTPVPQPTRTAK